MTSDDSHKNLMSYLRQADATFQNGFDSSEEKQIFLKNTFEEIAGGEVQFCLQKSFSFILEGMIKDADLETVVNFYGKIADEWSRVAESPSGSHVLQSICQRVTTYINQEKSHKSEATIRELPRLCRAFLLDSDTLSSIIKGVNSSHAFRSHIQMLGGMVLCSVKTDVKNILLNRDHIPKRFMKDLHAICSSLCDLDNRSFVEFLSDPHGSPSIAFILEVVSKRRLQKTLQLLSEKIMSCCSEKTMVIFLKDKHASHTVESVLQYGSPCAKEKIKETLCKDKKDFFDFCAHPVANFVVQRFISCNNDVEHLRDFLQYIGNGIEDILAGQNYGIIQKLCEQCLKFPGCQKLFYDKLLQAFHCKTVEDRAAVVLLFATLRTHDCVFMDGCDTTISTVEYHGSILLQNLLKFENIGLLVSSMGKIPIENIVILSCSSSGSHFIDAYFTSEKVKFKNKRGLVKKLEDKWLQIACNKYGSRVLENVWDSSDIAMKRLLAEFLVKSADILAGDNFGKYIHRKFQIKRFQTRREEWESVQKQKTNKRKLFTGIMPENKCSRKKIESNI